MPKAKPASKVTPPAPEALLLSVDQVKMMLGISKTQVLNMVRDGQMKATRIGRRILVSRAEVERIAKHGAP